MPSGEPPQDRDTGVVRKKLEEARRELLETSTRSRLLSTPLGSSRAKLIEVVHEQAESVFSVLVREGKAMTFAASRTARDDDQTGLELAQPLAEELDEQEIDLRRTDNKLQTALSSAKLQTRLRGLANDADTIQAEQGVNVLYLALGFLKWFEAHNADQPRYAPLILVPVTLTRASASERFRISFSGDEIGTNLSLQERLRADRVSLPDLPEPEDLSPTGYCEAVGRAIKGISGWEVQQDRIALGMFSFAKLMMYRDLNPELWPPRKNILGHAVLGGLLDWGFRDEAEPLVPDDSAIDPIIDIADAAHVVDADSSQMLAIRDVETGRHLVIQGPPGTGKSQTITNLIASAVRAGRRVLFVAEKMAALSVVKANLDRIGLGDLCLELHSHKAKKKEVLQSLKDAQQAPPISPPATDLAQSLRARRDALNAHVARMHAPLPPSGKSPFRVFATLARLEGLGLTAPDFQLPVSRTWTAQDFESRLKAIQRIAAHVLVMGTPNDHPWRGVRLEHVLPHDAERLGFRARELAESLSAWRARADQLAEQVAAPLLTLADLQPLTRLAEALERAPRLDFRCLANGVWKNRAGIVKLIQSGVTYSEAFHKLRDVLLPEAWDIEPKVMRATLAAHGTSLFRWLRADYRQAVHSFRAMHVGQLPRDLPQRLEVLDTLARGQRARRQIHETESIGHEAFSREWRSLDSDWGLLHEIEQWELSIQGVDLPTAWRSRAGAIPDVKEYAHSVLASAREAAEWEARLVTYFTSLSFDCLSGLGNATHSDVALETLLRRLLGFSASAGLLSQWCTWWILSGEERRHGLDPLIDRMADGRVLPARAVHLFEYVAHEPLARQAFELHRELAIFDGRSHEQLLAEFQQLDRQRLELARREVLASHSRMRPSGTREVGEIGILASEWNKQRRHKPLRQLVKAAGSAMQAIKPVWMMSPMSLAQFVEPGTVSFDLVLMDEASQVRPVEALGAVARAEQLVVVGDELQLPPTSFFDRVSVGDEEPINEEDTAAVADFESILGLCAAQGIPDRMLRWHYRSQHESLIAVSNLEFYRRLFIVPTANADDLGLRFHKVDGLYDRGRTATNRIEAQHVARAVIAHAQKYASPERFPRGMSLGVGAFSVTQRDAILDELELLWRQHPDLSPFFDRNVAEPFFVKNLESIQGDERDVIFISIGYGPDEHGVITGGFGPLTRAGGERRLNVLISRARRRCEVFSSLTAADIDLGRTQSFGVKVLKTFLQYAETGHQDRADIGKRAPDSDFEEDVAGALAAAGYLVEHQVGVAGFFVDLAIKDPEHNGRYILGIECDGAAYHSSRSARDRDRLREQVLRARHWRIHRIWGTDWYKRRKEELQRVIAAIERARTLDYASPAVEPDRPPEPVQRPVHAPRDLHDTGPRQSRPSQVYREADFVERMAVEPHEVGLGRLVPILVRIVEIEGPIHGEELARRYATVCGKQRAGSRIQEAVSQGLRRAVREGKVTKDGDFYSVGNDREVAPRDRSAARSITVRQADMLPPVEIRTGLRMIVVEHLGVEPGEAISEVARMFGFQRTGQDLQRVIEKQLRVLLGEGVLDLRNGNRLYPSDE